MKVSSHTVPRLLVSAPDLAAILHPDSSAGLAPPRTLSGAAKMTRCVCALGPRVLGSAVPTRAAPRGIARNVHVTWTLRRKMSRQHFRKAKAGCRVVVEAALPDEISGLTYVSPASSRAAASQTSGNPAVSQLALGSRKAATATATSKAPHGPATVVLTQNQLMATVGLFALGSVAACATAFMVVMAPALKAMERASVATEKASEQMEKAAVEFEKLSVQTNVDLPRTLEEMEKASEEWDALGEELREIIGNVERWGKFSGAEEALTKLTESILEEPGRAIDGARDEAESYLKRLTNDFDKAMGQLSDWERQLKGAVEGWDTQSWDEGIGRNGVFIDGVDSADIDDVTRDELIERRNARRLKVQEALAAAEAATEQAREASRALLSETDDGDETNNSKEEKLLEMGKQADEVSQRMKDALMAMEEAKGETSASARDTWK